MKPRELLAKVLTDPARREVADAIVLFADVMDSATISDIFDLLDYGHQVPVGIPACRSRNGS